MKTVIIGTDFIYDSMGSLKPIEMNTNIGFSLNKIESNLEEIFDSVPIKQFINLNNFSKLTYIGSNYKIKKFLENVSSELSIQFEEIYVSSSSVTIPNIEDSEDNLIIRTAYDINALLDEEYCKNKINFLNLIKNTEFKSQFAYLGQDNQIISTITEIKDNGVHPNFILKAIGPSYDKEIYPKLYKVSSQNELDIILQNLDSNHFIMEYHFNPDKVFHNQVTKIRKISLMYPPSLQSIHIGGYTDLSPQSLDPNPTYDPQSFELENSKRDGYITKDYGNIDRPKLLDTDFVVMADNTLKSALDLSVGDVIKTINIPGTTVKEITEDETIDYNIDYNNFINGVTYNTNRVVSRRRIDAYVKIGKMNFSDGTNWSDTVNSRYLVLNEGEVKFKRIDHLVAGDVILLINTSNTENVTIEQKTLLSMEEVSEKFSGWVITVEETFLFLTKTDTSSENSLSFAAIEHNNCNVPCGKGQCMTTPWAMVICNT